MKLRWIIAIVFMTLVGGWSCSEKHESTPKNIQPVLEFLHDRSPEFSLNTQRGALLFFINFADFNCHACFDDFRALCDSIEQKRAMGDQTPIAALFYPDSSYGIDNTPRLSLWTKANGISFPCIMVSDTLFRSLGFTKSSVVLLDNQSDVLLTNELPIGDSMRQMVLSYLYEQR
jgi:hypothetical protein